MILPKEWQPADGLRLEPNALRAATERVSCLALTAGPGAGKTEMLAQRADFLLRTRTCAYPKRILAISFKVDASRNLKARVQTRCGKDLSSRFDSYTFHAFAKRIIDRFRVVLTGSEALDSDYIISSEKKQRKSITFNDLVPLALKILRTSKVAKNAIRQTYSDVFLDEFQDCTDKQYELIKEAFLNTSIRLTAVGDTKQKIMAWAGALEGIFSEFAKDFDATPLNMYSNFRSKPRLLRMQNAMVQVLDPTSAMTDDQIIGDDGEIFAWGFNTSEEEAKEVANQVNNWLIHEKIPPSEIAILISKQIDLYADFLMAELKLLNIPFRNEQQVQDLSSEPVTRLIIDYLLSLFGTKEPVAWLRLMDQLIPFSDQDQQLALQSDWHRYIKSERKTAFTLGVIGPTISDIWPFVQSFLKKIGLSNLASLSHDYESKPYLIEIIKSTKSRIESGLLSHADLLKALNSFSDEQSVRIMTTHKSKGLEFDSVIILGVEKETFWGKALDERCAFFVGISRAKRRLILTVSKHRRTPLSNPYRWNENRNIHREFYGYAHKFLSKQKQ